jgi:hypothetical protein
MAFPDIAADLLDAMGPPDEDGSPLTEVTVSRIHPDTGAVIESASGVVALKRKYAKNPVGTGYGGEASDQVGSFRLWASYLDGLASPLKERDRIADADGVTWDIGGLSHEGFQGFVICDPCVKVRT